MCEATFEEVDVNCSSRAPRLGAHLFCPDCKQRVGCVVLRWPKEDQGIGRARVNYHEVEAEVARG
jgi:hypothetical protein